MRYYLNLQFRGRRVNEKHRNNVICFFHVCDQSHREDMLQQMDIVFTLKIFKNFNIVFN